MIWHNELFSISPLEGLDWENMNLWIYWKELKRLNSTIHAFYKNTLITLCN